MPKSKRNKVVSLTKTKKKNREWKEGLVASVRGAFEQYPNVYVFRHYNMRNDAIKQLREDLKEQGRFVMGSNKVLQVALGKTEADEYRTNLHYLSAMLKGSVGLFFTSLPQDEAVAVLEGCERDDFARVGAKATQDFTLSEGPLEGPGGPLSHTLEPQLRKYGLPTKLNKGVVELLADHTVCKKGQVLDPNQAAILRVFGVKMATFRLRAAAYWSQDGDKVTEISTAEGDSEGEEEEGAEGDEGEDEDEELEEADAFFPADDAAAMLPASLKK